MEFLTLDRERCNADGLCAAVCPSGCLESDADGRPVVVEEKLCIACGHCVAVCPKSALTISRVDPAALTKTLRHWPEPEIVDGMLRGRRSIRAYKNTPVARETMEALLDVARFAPTASNAQEVGWSVTVDPAKVRELAAMTAAYFETAGTRLKYSALWKAGRDAFLRGAPALAVAYVPADAPYGAADCGIALTFMELAAVARGLGTCWTGLLVRAARNDAALAKALAIPQGCVAEGGLMLGYPALRYAAVPPRNAVRARWL